MAAENARLALDFGGNDGKEVARGTELVDGVFDEGEDLDVGLVVSVGFEEVAEELVGRCEDSLEGSVVLDEFLGLAHEGIQRRRVVDQIEVCVDGNLGQERGVFCRGFEPFLAVRAGHTGALFPLP